MKTSLITIVTGLLCLSGIAMAQDVKYNFDPTVNFSKYHTYQFVALPTAYPDAIVDKQIKSDIESVLAGKGLTQVSENPDVQVGYQIAVNKQEQWNAWGNGGIRFGGGFASATSSTINIGTLGIDFFDPTSKSLVWRGAGTKTIDPSGNAEKNMEKMQKSIAKILQHFPPPVKK